MANTYSQIYIHCVFAVKYRKAVLNKSWRQEVFGVIGQLINETGCQTYIINGVEDHVHCFFSLKPKLSLSEVLKVAKSRSSKYINEHHLTEKRFSWQIGFGAFSYNQSNIPRVIRYIKNQEAHHERKKFLKEYKEFLTRFEIPYDEQYIFKELE